MQLTVLDMHRILDQEIQTMGFFTSEGLETEEIDLQINARIDDFIEAVVDKYKGKVPRIGVKEGFQSNQVRLDDLRTIHVKDYVGTLTAYDTLVGKKFDLPANYSHTIKVKIKYSVPCKTGNVSSTLTGTSSVRIVETEDVDIIRKTPFYETTKDSPVAEIIGNTVYIYSDNKFTITDAFLDYIKKPAVVLYNKDGSGNYQSSGSQDCDLPHTTHRTIIKMTAIHICSILESNPQKIVNLKEELN